MNIRRALLVGAIVVLSIASLSPVHADIATAVGPGDLAAAVSSDSSLVAGSAFVTRPPSGTPLGVSDIGTMGFPRHASTYAVLTSGDARAADVSGPSSAGNDDGDHVRGDNDFDVSILRIDLDVPAGANCLIFDFQFLTNEGAAASESNPASELRPPSHEWDDAFIAELNASTWTAIDGGEIWAPVNFARDKDGGMISVLLAEMTPSSSSRANYRAATQILNAATTVSAADANGALPGNNSLYLSIFDQGDRLFDSAAFVDNLRVMPVDEPTSQCVPGPYATLTASPAMAGVRPEIVAPNTLSARLTNPSEDPLADRLIDFYFVDSRPATWSPLCSATTDSAGVASCDPPLAAQPDTIGNGYHAIFNGDPLFSPAFATAPLVRIGEREIYR